MGTIIKEIMPTVTQDRERDYYLLPFFREVTIFPSAQHGRPSLLSSEYTCDYDYLGMQLHLNFQTLCMLQMCVNSGYLEGHTRNSLNIATVKFQHMCAHICVCVWGGGGRNLHIGNSHSALHRQSPYSHLIWLQQEKCLHYKQQIICIIWWKGDIAHTQ